MQGPWRRRHAASGVWDTHGHARADFWVFSTSWQGSVRHEHSRQHARPLRPSHSVRQGLESATIPQCKMCESGGGALSSHGLCREWWLKGGSRGAVLVDVHGLVHVGAGAEFEKRILANERGNAKFNFLDATDPYHAYYQMKVCLAGAFLLLPRSK
jgi:hypothetical protein